VTGEQDEDRERLRRYILHHQLVSRMNDTKWRAAIGALLAIPDFRPTFRVRCVRDRADPPSRWDASFPEHVPTFVDIEWLDINPLSHHQPSRDFSGSITAALRSVNASFEERADAIRIVGYTRPALPVG
jgi:hypothetical protein